MKIRRGNIVLLDFPFTSGHSSKVRPAVVVQSDELNDKLENCIVAQISTKIGSENRPTHVLIDFTTENAAITGLRAPSIVKCENLFTIHRDRILRVIGELPPTRLRELDEAIKRVFGLT